MGRRGRGHLEVVRGDGEAVQLHDSTRENLFWSHCSLFSLYKGRHGRVCSLQTRGETIEVTRVEG